MKKTFKIFMLFSFIAVMLFSPICMASNVTANEVTDDGVNGTYEFVASDVYKFDDDVVVDSIVDGNVFVFGNNITISSEIGGDVFAFGNTVTIAENAYVHGSIFVFANQFIMNGVCYDIYGGSQSVTLNEKAIVARDIRVAAEKVHINGQIKRDAYLSTNELVFPNDASNLIAGNLSYSSTSEFVIDKNVVGGQIKFTPEITEEATIAEKISSYITDILSTLLYSLAVVLLIIWLAPKFKEKATTILTKKAPLSFGVGLLTSIIVVIGAIALLFITRGLGFGISVAATIVFILALTISKTVFSMALAKLFSTKLKKDNNIVLTTITLLVVFVLSLIEIIPYIGGIVGAVVSMIGLGIIVLNLISKKDFINPSTKTADNLE